MKKFTLTLMLFLGLAVSAFAQGNNLVFFTENGEQFYVILNGIRQNEKPETNVMVRSLNGATYKARIIFADTTLGVLDKNLFMPTDPQEMTYVVKRDKKGEFVMRIMGSVPVAQAPAPPANRTVVVYTTTPPPKKTVSVQQTTTTVTTTPTDPNMNVNMNVGGMGMNINVNTNATGIPAQTTTTTTTTTTTGSTSYEHHESGYGHDHAHEHEHQEPVRETYHMPGYSGPVGCPYPMSAGDFASAKSSISSKSFEDSKLTLAKQIFDSNCLLASQVKDIMGLFSFEESKLDFAKYAYGRTFDLGNYYKVNDAFTFESSIDELNTYIQSHK